MVSVRPSRITSDFKPLAAFSFNTLVPYFRAMLDSVSPLLTVCFLLEVDFFADMPAFFDFEEEPEDFFFEEEPDFRSL